MSGSGHKRVVVMISGRGSNLGALISASMASGYPCRIVGVISDNPDAAGLKLAKDYDIETHVLDRKDFASREAHEEAVQAALESLGPDIICLAGYMRLLSGAFVGKWLGSMINIHPSLLPSFRGLDTHERVLAHQVRLHGCSVHFVTEGMDEGPLIAQAAVPKERSGSRPLRKSYLTNSQSPDRTTSSIPTRSTRSKARVNLVVHR